MARLILDPVNHFAFSNFAFGKKENQTGIRGLAERARDCYLLNIKFSALIQQIRI